MANIEQGSDIFDTYNSFKTIGNSVLDRLNNARDEAFQKKAQEMLKAESNATNSNSDNTTTQDEEIEEDAEIINNTITTNNKDSLNRYGIRQEIVIKSENEDANMKARRILSEHSKATEEITVKCLGDLDYRVGFGVHVYLPFFSKYYDCFMYVKEVEHEWLNSGLFTSTLTLTPSRVMDIQEWTDTTSSDEEDKEGSTASSSELWEKIYAVLKAQIGVPYKTGGITPDGFDCSGLVCYAYNQFSSETGITLNRTTESMVGQGKEIDKDNKEEWQAGDIILCRGNGAYPPPGHVVVYCGNNRMIHSSSDGVVETEFTRTDVMYVIRVLPESVSIYEGSNVDLPTEYVEKVKSMVEDAVSTTIKNMEEYGYKNNLIAICKQNNVDSYLMLGLISIESNGYPLAGTGRYKGLCQVDGGSTDPATNIRQGCEHYNEMCNYMGMCQTHVCLSAYNSGNATVEKSCKEAGIDYKTCSVKQLGDALYNYVKVHNPSWSPEEKKYYGVKVLLAQSILKSKNALG